MSPAAPDLAPSGDEEHRFFLAPLRHTKTLYLIRHGEGYHNFHHEFQHDYRNGVKPWQFDPTKWTIWLLEKVCLAHGLRTVPE